MQTYKRQHKKHKTKQTQKISNDSDTCMYVCMYVYEE